MENKLTIIELRQALLNNEQISNGIHFLNYNNERQHLYLMCHTPGCCDDDISATLDEAVTYALGLSSNWQKAIL